MSNGGNSPSMRIWHRMLRTRQGAFFLPLSLMRVAFGLFFFASGYNKLFLAGNRAAMLETITGIGVAHPHVVTPVVAACEALFGALLVLGLLSRLSAAVLLTISTVALLMVGIEQIPAGQSVLGWYSWLLYLPESLYILICIMLLVQGGGPWSLDTVLVSGRRSSAAAGGTRLR